MKKSLLLLGVIAALAIGAPAYSQYIYLDVNGDGVCTSTDLLTSSVTSVDLYLDTNHNANGTVAVCSDGSGSPLDFSSFDIIVHSEGSGSIAYNSFTPSSVITGAGFTQVNALTVAGSDAGVGYAISGITFASPGLYKLGTLGITVTGTPVLRYLGTSPDPSIPSFGTGFGSHCSGTDNPNTITLGLDFQDNCSTAAPTNAATMSTTWGKIKQLYR
jgi:hypothetical protein